MSYRLNLIAMVFIASTGSSLAEVAPALSLDLGQDGSLTATDYTCENGTSLSVHYLDSGVNSLAIVPIEDESHIFVAVIADSGVRYVSGPYTWWIKAKTAMLENVMDDGQPVSCTETS